VAGGKFGWRKRTQRENRRAPIADNRRSAAHRRARPRHSRPCFPIEKLLIDARFHTQVRRLKDVIVKDVRPILYLLQAAVVFVLLIGCVNVANLLLVRSNVRMPEWAVRFSLGASRFRLARQLLTESAVLAAGGGLLGVLVSFGSVRLLETLGTDTLPRGGNIAVNGQALTFTAICALLTGLVFGSAPVYYLLKRDLDSLVRSGGRGGTAGRSAVWTRSAMVVCQVSLAVVLLSGAGLLTLSFAKLLKVDPGFHPRNVVTAAFSMRGSRYSDAKTVRADLAELLTRLQAIPGVRAAGITSALPFSKSRQDGGL
jgi:putative ABC transport system permease protein